MAKDTLQQKRQKLANRFWKYGRHSKKFTNAIQIAITLVL